MKKEDVDAMTVHDAIEYALKKIVEQGKRCVGATGCAYGDDRGNHCFVGWLLDEDDKELMGFAEGLQGLVDIYEHRIPTMLTQYADLFEFLQEFHDHQNRDQRAATKRSVLLCMDSDDLAPTSAMSVLFDKWITMGEVEQ